MTNVHPRDDIGAAATNSPLDTRLNPSSHELTDAGLLSLVRAGTPIESAVCDLAWLQAMLDAEAALARAQARLGNLPADAADAITASAVADRLDLRSIALASRETANPVVALIRGLTEAVARHAPQAAQYVHRGSTSQDIFDTAAMLVAQRAMRLILQDLERTAAALGQLARAHRDTVMAGRTLVLHAVPTTFGLKAAGWRQLVRDAATRVRAVTDSLPVSLGGAAGTLAAYIEFARLDGVTTDPDLFLDELLAAFAEETGLARPVLPWHGLRTPMADIAAALAFTAGALGKISVDVLSLARTEVAEVAEPGPTGRGCSSAMPHKRNPVLSTLIRSAAIQVPALAQTLTQCLLAEDERSAGAWQAEWLPLRECLRLTGGAAHTAVELAEGLEVRPERMRDNLELTRGQVVSERLAVVLTPLLGKAEAKSLLARASVTAQSTGAALAECLAQEPSLAGVDVAALCDPTGYTGLAGVLVDHGLAAQ